MSFQYFIIYFTIVLVATITPGPSMLLAINHGASQGFNKTVYSGLGNLTANLLMAVVSIAGLSTLLIASGIIFNIIKWSGIIYLIYIGIKTFSQKIEKNIEETVENEKSFKSSQRLFIDGFVVGAGNPKGILFFTALFPQFINLNEASVFEFSIIFITLGFIAFGCFMLYAVIGTKIQLLFQIKSFKKIYNRTIGSLFIGMGVYLAFSKK